MEKGKIFISSTIYDFKDLRSSLKYWLSELGYEVFLSEKSDFPRDASKNTYESCLETIGKCDWFILFIGNRVGGTLIDEDTKEKISITRKEYRTAYKLFKEGKIKKLLVFVRSEVWQEKEIRKNLSKKIAIAKEEILKTTTKSLECPEEVFDFIDEVRRIKDIKECGESNTPLPAGNWVNVFDDFSEVVNCIKIELSIQNDLSRLIWVENLNREFALNLQKLLVKDGDRIFEFYDCAKRIRDDCVRKFIKNNRNRIQMTLNDFNILCLTHIRSITFNCSVLRESILNGFFLKFDSEKNRYVSDDFSINANLLLELIEVNNAVAKDGVESNYRLLEKLDHIKNLGQDNVDLDYTELAIVLAMQDRLCNIKELTVWLLKTIRNEIPDNLSLYPKRFCENFERKNVAVYDQIFGKEMPLEEVEKIIEEKRI